jgi:hypothetical protein
MNKNLSAIIFLISLFIGQANAQCAQGTSPSSSDSTCIQGTTGIATIASPSSSATAIMPFVPRANMSCTTPWGATVPEMGTVIAYQFPTGTFDPVLQENNCVYQERTCVSAVLSGTYQYEDCNSGPLNGACGAANGQTYTQPDAPAPQDLCNPTRNLDPNDPTETTWIYSSSSGNSIPPLTGSTFNWTCSGQNGGTTASCSANFVNTCSGPVTTTWESPTPQCEGTYNGTVVSGTTVAVNATPNATYPGTGTGSLYCQSNGTWAGGSGPIDCVVPPTCPIPQFVNVFNQCECSPWANLQVFGSQPSWQIGSDAQGPIYSCGYLDNNGGN